MFNAYEHLTDPHVFTADLIKMMSFYLARFSRKG